MPISYYPALPDADLDRLIQDENPYTVEYLVVSASQASRLDDKFLSEQLNEVRQYLEVSFYAIPNCWVFFKARRGDQNYGSEHPLLAVTESSAEATGSAT